MRAPGYRIPASPVSTIWAMWWTARARSWRASTRIGMTANLVAAEHPARKRVYFYDPEGNDWEFVQYFTTTSPPLHHHFTTDPSERNDYLR